MIIICDMSSFLNILSRLIEVAETQLDIYMLYINFLSFGQESIRYILVSSLLSPTMVIFNPFFVV